MLETRLLPRLAMSQNHRPPTTPPAQAAVTQACALIAQADSPPHLSTLAAAVGLSAAHFHRLFKSHTGLTPKAYAEAHRIARVRKALTQADVPITQALYDAGYGSNSRFYVHARRHLGMPPTVWRQGGQGLLIRFAVGPCLLGHVLVAATPHGVCTISLGDDPEALLRELQSRFSRAEFQGADPQFERWVAQVVGFIEMPQSGLDLPLDVQGTAFQHRVWQALCHIPLGRTCSYTEVAKALGQAQAARAVARACAANPVALAIPCHRVVRTDGQPSGYRWGIARKRCLLTREAQAAACDVLHDSPPFQATD